MHCIFNKACTCAPVPVWLDIQGPDKRPCCGEELQYHCKEGYRFPDNEDSKSSYCDSSGMWNPDFVQCEGKGKLKMKLYFS